MLETPISILIAVLYICCWMFASPRESGSSSTCPRYHLEASVGITTTIQNVFAGACVMASSLFSINLSIGKSVFSDISFILALVVNKYSLLIYSLILCLSST